MHSNCINYYLDLNYFYNCINFYCFIKTTSMLSAKDISTPIVQFHMSADNIMAQAYILYLLRKTTNISAVTYSSCESLLRFCLHGSTTLAPSCTHKQETQWIWSWCTSCWIPDIIFNLGFYHMVYKLQCYKMLFSNEKIYCNLFCCFLGKALTD